MNWRRRKQILIAFIFFIILSLPGYFIYLKFKPLPSCHNNRQDYNEEGVDCGGPCVPCEVYELKELKIKQPQIVIYPDQTMDVVVPITNPNEEYGLKNFKYEIYFYGPNNEIAKISGESFILPLEEKYLVESNISAPKFSIKKSEAKITFSKEDWFKTEQRKPNIELLNYDYGKNYFSARILNKDYQNYNKIKLYFLLYDEFDTLIGTLKSEIYDIKAQEQKDIKILSLPPLLTEIKNVILYSESEIEQ